jgi:hypothetical protein
MIGIVFAGGQADRHGLGRPYVIGLSLFAVGLVVRRAGTVDAGPRRRPLRPGIRRGVVPAIGYVAIGRVYPIDVRPRMFAVLSTAWVVPGVVGRARRTGLRLGQLASGLPGLLPLVAVAGSLIIPQMMRLHAPAGADSASPEPHSVVPTTNGRSGTRRDRHRARRRQPPTAWAIGPALVGGTLIGLGPLRRLAPPGTLRAAVGLPAVVLSRGLLTFAFFGADTFVPYALTEVAAPRRSPGAFAVTTATLGWTAATWIQERFITRTGEAYFARAGYLTMTPGLVIVAVVSATDALPFWVIHLGWTLGGFGMGLAYSAHAQLTLRCSPAAQYGSATAALQLFDNLGVALGAGVAGAVVTFGDDVGWDPGRPSPRLSSPPPSAALSGVVVTRRFPQSVMKPLTSARR